MSRPYYALNGREIIEVVTGEVKQYMEKSGDFPAHRTFPEVSWKWQIEFTVYPAEPPSVKVKGEGLTRADDPKGEPVPVKLEGGRGGIGKSVAPDQVRVEAGIPLSKPVTKAGMGTVDELMKSLEAPGK